jgi:hypothetical protein
MSDTTTNPLVGIILTNYLPGIEDNIVLTGSAINLISLPSISPGEIFIDSLISGPQSYSLTIEFNKTGVPPINLTLSPNGIVKRELSPEWETVADNKFIFPEQAYVVEFYPVSADTMAIIKGSGTDPLGIAMVGTVSTLGSPPPPFIITDKTFTIEAIDNSGNPIFKYTVPAYKNISVRMILEVAFNRNQSSTTHDPFHFTLEYYGYSTDPSFPGYLGYELESINSLTTTANFYWSLAVNGAASLTGIDTTFPNPGSTITLTYTSTNGLDDLRSKAISKRRASRKSGK